jgi:hypothetical protein
MGTSKIVPVAALSGHQVVRRRDAVNIDKRSGGLSSWDAVLDAGGRNRLERGGSGRMAHATDEPCVAFWAVLVLC